MMNNIARLFLLLGVVSLAVGLLLLLAPRIPWLGRLPGDIVIRKRNVTLYFPLATSVVISILLSVLLSFFRK